jgi:hypothetical protein
MKSYKFKDLKVGQNFITEFKGKHCELIKIESSYDKSIWGNHFNAIRLHDGLRLFCHELEFCEIEDEHANII